MSHFPFSRIVFLLALLLGGLPGLFAQYGTPTLNGTTTIAEYTGNEYNLTGGAWRMTWNTTDLFIAKTGGSSTHPILIYLDVNPGIPVNNNTSGSLVGDVEWGYQPQLPFSGVMRIYWEPGANNAFVSLGAAGVWTFLGDDTSLPAQIQTAYSPDGELRLSWSLFGGGIPTAFNALMYQIDNSSGFLYHAAPGYNPNGTIGGGSPISRNCHYFFSIPNTADPTATGAFNDLSFTQFNQGEYVMNLAGQAFYDFTINDNSTDNLDNAGGNNLAPIANRVMVSESFEIKHDLYIGQGSALMPQTGLSRTINLSGPNGSIWNYGRLDANPDISSLAAVNTRRLAFVFSGNTTLQPSPLFIDHYRFSNITIPTGASLVASGSGTAEFEVEWGVMTVDGTLDLYNNATSYVNMVVRGVVTPLMNDYYVTGDGSFEFHDLIIGRDSARIQPVLSATADTIELVVKGYLGVFGGYRGRSSQAVMGVCMCGSDAQTIEGHVDQTFNQVVTFSLLRIHNDNLLSNANAGADVSFLTYDSGTPGTIDYFVDGRLTLEEGDVVTRSGGSCNAGGIVHNLTVLNGASLVFLDSLSNDVAGNGPSSYIDGPLRREVMAAISTKVDFPVGKAGAGRDIQFNLLHSDATPVVYEVELSDCPPPALSMAPTAGTPAFELLSIRPQPRYWEVTFNPDGSAGAPSVTQAGVKMFFDSDDVSGATDPGALRVIKDDGAAGYVNYGGSAATLGPDQIPSTFDFSDFGIFTLGLPPVLDNSEQPVLHAKWQTGTPFLEWNAPGQPISGYEIWRRHPGEGWVEAGTCTDLSYLDQEPFEAGKTLQYQIRALTPDGHSLWSNTVELHPATEEGNWRVQTDGIDAVRVFFEKYEGPFSLRLVNAHGQILTAVNGYTNSAEPVILARKGQLAAGIYWVIRESEGVRDVKSLRIQEK